MENVDSGLSTAFRNGFSWKRPYSSMLCSTSGASTAPPMTPPATPPATKPYASLFLSAGTAGGGTSGGGGGGAEVAMLRSSTTFGGGPPISFLHDSSSNVVNNSADRMTMTVSTGEETETSFGLRRVRIGVLLSTNLDTAFLRDETARARIRAAPRHRASRWRVLARAPHRRRGARGLLRA